MKHVPLAIPSSGNPLNQSKKETDPWETIFGILLSYPLFTFLITKEWLSRLPFSYFLLDFCKDHKYFFTLVQDANFVDNLLGSTGITSLANRWNLFDYVLTKFVHADEAIRKLFVFLIKEVGQSWKILLT